MTLSSPSKRLLGATNGLAATVEAAMRSIGPAAATSLFAVTREQNLLGGYLVYVVLLLLTVVTICAASLLPLHEEDWEDSDETLEDE